MGETGSLRSKREELVEDMRRGEGEEKRGGSSLRFNHVEDDGGTRHEFNLLKGTHRGSAVKSS